MKNIKKGLITYYYSYFIIVNDEQTFSYVLFISFASKFIK